MSLAGVKWLVSVGVVLITAVLGAVVWHKPKEQCIWLISSCFSLLCIVGIAIIWQWVREAPLELDLCSPVTSQEELDSQLKNFNPEGEAPPVFIPTGVFLQSIEFVTSNNARVTGYIWQKYPKDLPTEIERGISFPEGVSTELDEAYRNIQGETETIGWHFTTTLREEYYYNKYPFDRQDIWLSIWPNDFDHNVILVPDLSSYESIAPERLPGLKGYFVLENWIIKGSYFSFCHPDENSNFGIATNTRESEQLELEFNVSIERNSLGAMLNFVSPPLITALLMFGILLITTSRSEKASLIGWSTSTSLGFSASLLFVIVYAQISMRAQLNAPGIIYLEYLYFIVYVAIVLVSIDSILFAYTDQNSIIQYQDNLIPKTIYWPLLTGSFLLITLLTFH